MLQRCRPGVSAGMFGVHTASRCLPLAVTLALLGCVAMLPSRASAGDLQCFTGLASCWLKIGSGSNFGRSWYDFIFEYPDADTIDEVIVAADICSKAHTDTASTCILTCPYHVEVTHPAHLRGYVMCLRTESLDPYDPSAQLDSLHPMNGREMTITTLPPEAEVGCTPDDYTGIQLNGSLHIVSRGGCWFFSKFRHAKSAGAAAVVVVNSFFSEQLALQETVMVGDRTGLEGLPIGFASSQEGYPLMEYARNGALRGTLNFACSRAVPAAQLEEHRDVMDVEGCPTPHLINKCNAMQDESDRLCSRCKIAFGLPAAESREGDALLTMCLWGSPLHPRRRANHLWSTTGLGKAADLLLLSLDSDLCARSTYAAVKGRIVVLPYPQRCLAYHAVRYASAAGVAGVIILADLQRDTAPSIEGPSFLINVPLHSMSVNDTSVFLEVAKQRGVPEAAGVRVSGIFLEGPPPQPAAESVVKEPFRVKANAAAGEPGLQFTTRFVMGLSGSVAVVFAVAGKLVHTWQSAQKADRFGNQLQIPLGVASAVISLAFFLMVAGTVFGLTYTAGRDVAETAISHGELTRDLIYISAVDSVNIIAAKLHIQMIGSISQMILSLLLQGERTALQSATCFRDCNTSWVSMNAAYPCIVDAHQMSLAEGAGYVTSVTSPNSFFFQSASKTDDRSDAERGDGIPHVSVTNNGTLYGIITYIYNPGTQLNEFLAVALATGMTRLGMVHGSKEDVHKMTRGVPDKFMTWRVADHVEKPFDGPEGFPTQPLSVYTPVYSRNREYLGVAEAWLEVDDLSQVLRDAVKQKDTSQMEVVMFDIDTENSIAASGVHTSTTVMNYRGVWLTNARKLLPLRHLASLELSGLHVALKAELQGKPLGEWLRSGAGAPEPSLFPLDFDQREMHEKLPLFTTLLLGVDPVTREGRDLSANRVSVEMVEGEGGSLCHTPQCTVFDKEMGADVMEFTGRNVVYIYKNLTTDAGIVQGTRVSRPSHPWRSSNPYFSKTIRLTDDTECVASYYPQRSRDECILHPSLVANVDFTLYTRVKPLPSAGGATSSVGVIFGELAGGPLAYALYADGRFRIGSSSYVCETPPFRKGIPPGEWTTITVSVRALRNCSVYLNGAPHATVSYGPAEDEASFYPYVVGRGFAGRVSELLFLNRSIGSEEMFEGVQPHHLILRETVEERRWIGQIGTFSRSDSLHVGVRWAVAVLTPRASIMQEVDSNMQTASLNFAAHAQDNWNTLNQKAYETIAIITLVSFGSVLIFLFLNDALTRPFASVACIMKEAAVMSIRTMPEQQSFISELNTIYRSMFLLLENLGSYRPFLPQALFEKQVGWVKREPQKNPEGPPGASTQVAAIVFTDIQSSTMMWEQSPEGMRAALKTHNQVIRENMDRFGGYEVKTIGDSYMVAFKKASSACRFALEVQQNMYEADWPDPLLELSLCKRVAEQQWAGLRLRIGINFGEVDLDYNAVTHRYDYFGSTVNKAARVEAVGISGAVTVTAEVLEEVLEEEAVTAHGEAAYRDVVVSREYIVLGKPLTFLLPEVELRGVDGTVHLYVLLPRGLSGRAEYVSSQLLHQRVSRRSIPDLNPLRGMNTDTCSRKSNASNSSDMSGDSSGSITPIASKSSQRMQRKSSASVVKMHIPLMDINPEVIDASGINEQILRALAFIERTEGSVLCIVGCSVYATWNAARAITYHTESAFRLSRMLRSTQGKGRRAYALGIATGPVLYGSTGNASARYITVFGPCLNLCGHLCDAAIHLKTLTLFASATGSRFKPQEVEGRMCRPIDTWEVRGSPVVISVFEVRSELDGVLDDWDMRKVESEFHVSWNWSEAYAQAFENSDYGAILERCKGDTTLLSVAELLKYNNHLRTDLVL